MSEFLLEIYGEEIPPSSQKFMEEELIYLFSSFFDEKKIEFSKFTAYSTPRRIILFSKSVSKILETVSTEIRGPSTSANNKAINGFMKSNNIKNFSQLIKKKIKQKEYYFFKKKNPSQETKDILRESLPKILGSVRWKKSMRWSNFNDRWIRPIKNILCVFDQKKILFKFAGINSDIFTFGNYHYNNKKIKCLKISDYLKIMKKNEVIIDKDERKKIIYEKLKNFCQKKVMKNEFDDKLVSRVADTVEFPNIFFGRFEKNFLSMPSFLIEAIISEKQDYFCFKNKKGQISIFFGFVSNKKKDLKKKIIVGYEKVLKARFSDALFFLNEDKKKTFSERIKKLKKIIFYENVGNLYDRSIRVSKLTEEISKIIGLKIDDKIKKSLEYSNSDLVTEIVKEFPSLQGKIGGYYASLNSFDEKVCLAFSQQYNNSFMSRETNKLSFALALAQKSDSIFGFFGSEKKLSGAGDPYGLRRSVLGIIKISIEKELDIEFSKILKECKKNFDEQGLKNNIDIAKIIEFFNKRIFIYLNEIGFSQKIVKTNLNNYYFNPYLIYKKTKILENFCNSTTGKNFLQAFKRLDSLIDDNERIIKIDLSLLLKHEEQELHKKIVFLEKKITLEKNKYNDLSFLDEISKPLNNFLDKIVVNVDDNILKKNRKMLLLNCKKILNSYFDFSAVVK